MCEQNLIKRLQDKDEDAFWELYSIHREILYKISFSYVGNQEDAMDILQETWIKIWQNAERYKPQDNKTFGMWLTTVAKNTAKNFLRKKNTAKNRVTSEVPLMLLEDMKADPISGVVNRELKKTILDKMESALSGRQREMLLLKYREGLTYGDIATKENCSVGTVKATVSRAIQKLREAFNAKSITLTDYI